MNGYPRAGFHYTCTCTEVSWKRAEGWSIIGYWYNYSYIADTSILTEKYYRSVPQVPPTLYMHCNLSFTAYMRGWQCTVSTLGFSGRALWLQRGHSSRGYHLKQLTTRWLAINCSEGLGSNGGSLERGRETHTLYTGRLELLFTEQQITMPFPSQILYVRKIVSNQTLCRKLVSNQGDNVCVRQWWKGVTGQ